jgi:uncharacterized protein
MGKILKLTKPEARALALRAEKNFLRQGIDEGLEGARQAIDRLGYLQIDTISRVERAHHHILWTRVPGYEPRHLTELEARPRRIVEYWSHAASYLPIESIRFALPRMMFARSRTPHWMPRNAGICEAVLRRIEKEGPLQAKDFEQSKEKRTGWWDWKPAKVALEHLFTEGRLLVSGRRGFQKVYDLAERVVPEISSLQVPSERDMSEYLVESSLRRLGLASAHDIAYLRRIGKRDIPAVIKERISQGDLVEFVVEGGIKQHYFATPAFLDEPSVGKTARKHGAKTLAILSPFDPFIINRKRVVELFEFDFRIECYLPEAKRRYGYFSLPILWGDRFVGLVDARADRKNSTLVIEAFHLIEKAGDAKDFYAALSAELHRFALFNRCSLIEVVTPARGGASRELYRSL